MKKVILVTGASSGIGFATVEKLVADGHIVYGTGRKKEDLEKIANAGAESVTLEMTDESSMQKAIDKILKEQKRIDVLFNNAGYGLYGSVEEIPIDDARNQFEVNLFGLARLTQIVLPHMRKKKSGTIINTSSMGGKMYTPLGAWYHATKHALEGWSDCLRLELKQFGINVVILEPGGIQTAWGIIAADNIENNSKDGPYSSYAKETATSMKKMYGDQGKLTPPSQIADVVSKIIAADRPKTRYVSGKYARPLMFVRKYFGDRIFDRVVS